LKVIFLKNGYYRGVYYKKDSTIDISELDIKAYIDCKVVKRICPVKKNINHVKSIQFENMSYKDLQKICKAKNLMAVGKKAELINLLKQNQSNIK
jgi:hypothetical protein